MTDDAPRLPRAAAAAPDPVVPASPGSPDAEHAVRLAALRHEYVRASLDEADLAPDPFTQFHAWFADAVASGLPEPNATVLATASADAEPSGRTVLLKGLDERGFVLFGQSTSRKGQDLAANPRASLVFPWFVMDRQVVVLGHVEPVDRATTATYFASRPRGSRLGAWASEQSTVVPDRTAIDDAFTAADRRWPGDVPVPLPDRWVGYRVLPHTVEFWQGRPSRLHDRLRYRLADGRWSVERLAP